MHITKAELKFLRSLSQKKVRETEGKFLLEGWKPLAEAIASSFTVGMIVVASGEDDTPERRIVLDAVRTRSIPVKEMTALELRQLTDTVTAQGVIALVHQKKDQLTDVALRNARLLVVGDAISDPGNLGSIVRSADWYAADMVLLGEGSVSLYNEKVIRSTAGSLFHVPVVEHLDLRTTLAHLRAAGYHVAIADANGTTLDWPSSGWDRIALVVGNEAHGVAPALRTGADAIVSIARYGNAESLNVGVATAILLDRIRQRDTSPRGA